MGNTDDGPVGDLRSRIVLGVIESLVDGDPVVTIAVDSERLVIDW